MSSFQSNYHVLMWFFLVLPLAIITSGEPIYRQHSPLSAGQVAQTNDNSSPVHEFPSLVVEKRPLNAGYRMPDDAPLVLDILKVLVTNENADNIQISNAEFQSDAERSPTADEIALPRAIDFGGDESEINTGLPPERSAPANSVKRRHDGRGGDATRRRKRNVNHDEHYYQENGHHRGVHIASWKWADIGDMFAACSFILVAGIMKVAFHHIHFLSHHVPESCVLLLLGVVVGGLLYAVGALPYHNSDELLVSMEGATFPAFTPRFFFFILLPPIILEAAYSLYDRAFFANLGSILLFAIIGTLFNTLAIGSSLYMLNEFDVVGMKDTRIFSQTIPENQTNLTATDLQDESPYDETMFEQTYTLSYTDSLVFSALISAVDPVAVLAIFQEIGVNADLYFLVFGESLLNDATTVVLYNMMVAFAGLPDIDGYQLLLGVAAFFTVSCGGLLIGAIFGLLTALLTKTTASVRVVEPLLVFGMAYLSYLSAELFHFSGIISIIGCGIMQAHYALKNISQKSHTTVKYFIKMLSATNDAIIFLYLGMVLISDEHQWNTGFVLWTLVLCLVFRFIGVFTLTAIANEYRVRKIEVREQFIMSYGGLRGAVGFSLVLMLDPATIQPRHIFVTTTLVVVLFTVFIQGGTIQLMVKLLEIQKAHETERSMCQEFTETVMSRMMAGVEEIIGMQGRFAARQTFENIDNRFLKSWFLADKSYHRLTQLYSKIALTEHYAHLYGPSILVANEKTPLLDTADETEDGLGGDDDSKKEEEEIEKEPVVSDLKRPSFKAVGHRLMSSMRLSKQLEEEQMQVQASIDSTVVHIGKAGDKTSHADSRRHSASSSVGRVPATPSPANEKLLRMAFKRTSWNKMKYNTDPVDEDDDEEMLKQLEERRKKARRIVQIAAFAAKNMAATSAAAAAVDEKQRTASDPLAVPRSPGLQRTAASGAATAAKEDETQMLRKAYSMRKRRNVTTSLTMSKEHIPDDAAK